MGDLDSANLVLKNIQSYWANPTVQIIIYAFVSHIILGIFLGLKKKVIVYNDFNDMGVCLLLFLLPIIGFIALPILGYPLNSIFTYILLGTIALILLSVAHSTIKTNGFLKGIYSLSIKLPISIVFSILIFEVFNMKGRRRESNKGLVYFIMLVFAPILIGLVADKKGVFRPNYLLRRYNV